MQDEDEEAYKRQFARFVKDGITADKLEGIYQSAHAAIRKNPDMEKKPEKKVEKKRYAYCLFYILNDTFS